MPDYQKLKAKNQKQSFALYIHYPFCICRCPYCGFSTAVEKKDVSARYREALLQELERRAGADPWRDGALHSVYFGGGTPSLMPPDYLKGLLRRIAELWGMPDDIEVTLEANPGTRETERFAAFREAGINRLSMGAQSFHSQELNLLGRDHTVEETTDAVRLARESGFWNISLDIIYGVPGQTVDSFRDSARKAVDLGVEHLSTYGLSIEQGTPFERRVKRGRLSHPDPDLMADQYAALIDLMRDAGFEHYELTNFTLPDRWSRHNFAYWRRIPYLGLGCGAHSFNGVRRRSWNLRDTKEYTAIVFEGGDACAGQELLTDGQVFEEKVYLGLRTWDGVDRELLDKAKSPGILNDFVNGGYLSRRDGRYRMREERWLMLDEVVMKLE